ncbi:MAG: mechanosensitive ion channel family protein [Pseudolabrys sp.]|jgi:small conductance mechanosensitive channel
MHLAAATQVTQVTGEISTFLDGLAVWAAATVPRIVGAVVLLVVGWWIAGRAQHAMAALLTRQNHIDAMLSGVIASVVRYAILIVVVVAVLGQLGIQTTSILAALGAAGLAIGLAMQGTLANIAAGMMLLWLRPFQVGDYIDSGSAAGTVKSLGLFASELHSWDGIYQFVPNSELWNKKIINYSRLPTRLVDLGFGVSYEDDLAKGQEVLLKLAGDDARVAADPAPQTFVDELGDSAVVLRLRVWASNSDYWTLRRALTEGGKLALEAAGLTIPFPQRDLHIKDAPKDTIEGERAVA